MGALGKDFDENSLVDFIQESPAIITTTSVHHPVLVQDQF